MFPEITDATVYPNACSGSSTADAIALGDALGVFGYYNLQLAALFDYVCPNDAEGFTFRLYRNYDGAGSTFGTTSVTGTSSNPAFLSIYPATRASDGALTFMVVNKESTAFTTPVSISGYTPQSSVNVYQYSNASPNAIAHSTTTAATVTGAGLTYPAYSITEVIMEPSGTPQATTPVATPGTGTYSSSQSVALSNPSGAPVVCYNTTGAPATNNTTGCAAGSTLYTGAITVASSETLYYVAGGTGWLDSAVGSSVYTITGVAVPAAPSNVIILSALRK
jgi:hypothetical protein